MTSAQNISPQQARLWTDLSQQFRQDVGSNILPDGDFESPVAVPPWVETGVTTTLIPGARPGGTGTQYARVTNLVVGARYIAQTIFAPINQYWHVSGWFRGDPTGSAAQVYSGGTVGFFATNLTNNWAEFDRAGFFDNTQIRLYVSSGVGLYSEFDDVSVIEYPMTSRNVGESSGAPTYIRMGDGHAAASIPAQIARARGMRLNGSNYMRVPLDFDRAQPFTIAVFAATPMAAASWLAATYDSATLRGVRFGTTGSRQLVGGIFDDGGRSITATSLANVIPSGSMPHLYCLTYDGSSNAAGLELSIDDLTVPSAGAGTPLASSISSGRDLLLGGRWNAATPTELLANGSSILWAGEFPRPLGAFERRLLRGRVMREVGVGL